MPALPKFLKKIFSDPELETVRDIAVGKLFDAIDDYATWYSEHGLFLPPDFVTDPGTWTIILSKMQRAFKLLNDESYEEGELWDAKHKWDNFGEKDNQKIKELEKEIQEGLALFGKYLFWLTDKKECKS